MVNERNSNEFYHRFGNEPDVYSLNIAAFNLVQLLVPFLLDVILIYAIQFCQQLHLSPILFYYISRQSYKRRSQILVRYLVVGLVGLAGLGLPLLGLVGFVLWLVSGLAEFGTAIYRIAHKSLTTR